MEATEAVQHEERQTAAAVSETTTQPGYLVMIRERLARLKSRSPSWLCVVLCVLECCLRSVGEGWSTVCTLPGRASGCKKPRLKIVSDDGNQICENGGKSAGYISSLTELFTSLPYKIYVYITKTVVKLSRKAAYIAITTRVGKVVVRVLRSVSRSNRKALKYLHEQSESSSAVGSVWARLVSRVKSTSFFLLESPLEISLAVVEACCKIVHKYGCDRSLRPRNGHATSPRKTSPRKKVSPHKRYPTSLLGRFVWRSKRVLGFASILPKVKLDTMKELDGECCAEVECECDKKRKYDDITSDSESDCNLLTFDDTKYESDEDETYLPGDTSSDSLEYNEGDTESDSEIDPHHIISTNRVPPAAEAPSLHTSPVETLDSGVEIAKRCLEIAESKPVAINNTIRAAGCKEIGVSDVGRTNARVDPNRVNHPVCIKLGSEEDPKCVESKSKSKKLASVGGKMSVDENAKRSNVHTSRKYVASADMGVSGGAGTNLNDRKLITTHLTGDKVAVVGSLSAKKKTGAKPKSTCAKNVSKVNSKAEKARCDLNKLTGSTGEDVKGGESDFSDLSLSDASLLETTNGAVESVLNDMMVKLT